MQGSETRTQVAHGGGGRGRGGGRVGRGKARVVWRERMRPAVGGIEARQLDLGKTRYNLGGHCGGLEFYSWRDGQPWKVLSTRVALFRICFSSKMKKGSGLNKTVSLSLSHRDTVQGILTCGPCTHVQDHMCNPGSRMEEGTVTRDKGQIPVLVKEVPLLLNHGPEITKALTQLHRKLGEVVVSRWSWLRHVVCDFGRKENGFLHI